MKNNDSWPKIAFAVILLSLVFWNHEAGMLSKTNYKKVEVYAGSSRFLNAAMEDNSPVLNGWDEKPINSHANTAVGVGINKADTSALGVSSTIREEAKTPPIAKPNPISISTPIFLISDLNQDENIFSSGADKRWPTASLAKLMTAVIAVENIPLSAQISVTAESVNADNTPSKILHAGEAYSLEDLLKGIFLISANDAALSISQYYGEEKFVKAMNDKALELGMSDTFFKEPTGLSPVNQSTANDLKKLVRYLDRNHKDVLRYSLLKEAYLTDIISKHSLLIKSINYFSGRPDFLGGKTGYIQDSGENLLSLFSRNGKTVIIIVMDAVDRFAETSAILNKFDRMNRQ